MHRKSTKIKEKLVLKAFHKLLRSGKDYSTKYMYQEAGEPCFISAKTAGNIVRKHYRSIITEEMSDFVYCLNEISTDERIMQFSREFRLCERESRLIIRYILRRELK